MEYLEFRVFWCHLPVSRAAKTTIAMFKALKVRVLRGSWATGVEFSGAGGGAADAGFVGGPGEPRGSCGAAHLGS